METVDMLTDFIQNFLNKNIGELEDKNILITLPNKKRIELGNHQSSIEITFNSWLGIWIIFRRGALGLTEGYINNYWQTEDLIELMEYLPKNLQAFSKISNGMLSLKIFAKINHFFNKNTLHKNVNCLINNKKATVWRYSSAMYILNVDINLFKKYLRWRRNFEKLWTFRSTKIQKLFSVIDRILYYFICLWVWQCTYG